MNFEIGSPEDVALTSELRSSGAGVVFVSLGAPRQAIWMARHTADLPNSVLVGVGAAVDVLAGRVSAAPVWMTRVGLEWLYRLLHEPRRLARRYLVDDPRFFLWVLGQRLRRP
jgi:N-acetylglucosaminyldiphosphoundecaprenol N-acetyl-beta-D-mannosaminyltransferase